MLMVSLSEENVKLSKLKPPGEKDSCGAQRSEVLSRLERLKSGGPNDSEVVNVKGEKSVRGEAPLSVCSTLHASKVVSGTTDDTTVGPEIEGGISARVLELLRCSRWPSLFEGAE